MKRIQMIKLIADSEDVLTEEELAELLYKSNFFFHEMKPIDIIDSINDGQTDLGNTNSTGMLIRAELFRLYTALVALVDMVPSMNQQEAARAYKFAQEAISFLREVDRTSIGSYGAIFGKVYSKAKELQEKIAAHAIEQGWTKASADGETKTDLSDELISPFVPWDKPEEKR